MRETLVVEVGDIVVIVGFDDIGAPFVGFGPSRAVSRVMGVEEV